VSAGVLRDVLDVVIEGSKRAVRMRTQGRSSARGKVPEWIEATADYSVELNPGSTVLDLRVPTLLEAAPDTFGQGEMFPEVDPERSSFHYFSESLAAAVAGDTDSPLFDRGLLEVFRRLDRAFDGGADAVTVENGREVRVRREHMQELARLEARIPPPQYVRVAGRLDAIRYSDRTFTILSTTQNQRFRGIAEPRHVPDLQELWTRPVVVAGTAHFTPSGGLLRIEADGLRAARPDEESLWGKPPRPLAQSQQTTELRVHQGPRSGINAIFGRWPGDESDEEVLDALEQLS
jgi:hypothetical protein